MQDLLYEIVWRDRPLGAGRMPPADFLTSPAGVAAGSLPFTQYLANEGVDGGEHAGLLDDLERLSRAYALAALERLGWQRTAGQFVAPEAERQRLNVAPAHQRLFRRLFEMLAAAGVLAESGDGFVVKVGHDDPLPEGMPDDPDALGGRDERAIRARRHRNRADPAVRRRRLGRRAHRPSGPAEPAV